MLTYIIAFACKAQNNHTLNELSLASSHVGLIIQRIIGALELQIHRLGVFQKLIYNMSPNVS